MGRIVEVADAGLKIELDTDGKFVRFVTKDQSDIGVPRVIANLTGGIEIPGAVAGRSAALLAANPTAHDIALGDSTIFYDIADPTKRYAMTADHAAFTAIAGSSGGSAAPVALTATRDTTSADNGAVLENATSSTLTLTLIASTIAKGLTLQNIGTGQIVVLLGAGVTLVDGATSVSAPFQGQMIHIIPTATENKFLAKVG